ncbi:YgiW/YdeI family stress tolerance OB fold protein [Alicycliphilus sp. T452]|jgi:uncharacterized protein (TIGR00156 family)
MTERRIVFAALALAPALAWAQYTGPSAEPVARTVREVLAQPRDGRPAHLRGHLLRQIGPEKYLFSDGTGEVRVEIDDALFLGRPVDQRTAVELRGEVDSDFLEAVEVEVDSLQMQGH